MNNSNQRPAGTGGQPRRPTPARPGARPQRRQGTPPNGRAPQQQPKKQRKRSENRWFRAIVMVLCTLGLCIFLAIFILQSANDLFGLNQEDKQIEVTIPAGATRSQVASILSKAGVVDQNLTFQLYASIKEGQRYLPGTYVFNSNMGYDEILRDLRTSTSQMASVKITFVEGENVYEIASKLEEKEVCDAQAFLDHLQTGEFGYEFMDQLPEDDRLRFRRLEGYLFPDTYEFYVGENVDSVARKFLGTFNTKIGSALKDRMKDRGLTLDETLTLASIIQKEAGGVHGIDEMKRVSSVFHNRLAVPSTFPKLQSDVTVHYVDNFIKPFHDIRNQNMYDAYNTYVCNGLPVGPICNPGLDAIEAALYPEDTGYYFFVTDVQENFYYSVTAQEHYQKVIEASRVEGEGKIHGIDTQ